jgi:para-nitrobenzyl esterase
MSRREMNCCKKISALTLGLALAVCALAADQVQVASGTLEGFTSPDKKIRIFEGIPYAAPPVGNLRWQPPQPAASWTGVRKATAFGSRCMQGNIFKDMIFRDPGPSEDCLTLNVWTPATSADEHLPVMVWIFGGGFQAGGTSEPRQDGTQLAHKGVIVVSMNYRLGVFGFFSHPELTKESAHHASGNYGLLDQAAALEWVKNNIAAFGGDPANVTIFGESAGSMSVSAQMASPVSKGLFKQAIGESGGVFGLRTPMNTVEKSEQIGKQFATSLGAANLEALRAKPANEILQASLKKENGFRFWPNVDGYFFPENPWAIYAAGQQAQVPLLAGWNADEQNAATFFGKSKPTKKNYVKKVQADFGSHADEVLKLFPDSTGAEMMQSAHDLASAEFITYSTWKWLNMQVEKGNAPVYAYHFEQVTPPEPGKKSHGAFHSSDIQFVFETQDSEKLAWSADDRKMSDMMSSYWTNFAKTGDPNGSGLPHWPRYDENTQYSIMHLQLGPSAQPEAKPASNRAQYELLDRIATARLQK